MFVPSRDTNFGSTHSATRPCGQFALDALTVLQVSKAVRESSSASAVNPLVSTAAKILSRSLAISFNKGAFAIWFEGFGQTYKGKVKLVIPSIVEFAVR